VTAPHHQTTEEVLDKAFTCKSNKIKDLVAFPFNPHIANQA
jgi:hypothetical protein